MGHSQAYPMQCNHLHISPCVFDWLSQHTTSMTYPMTTTIMLREPEGSVASLNRLQRHGPAARVVPVLMPSQGRVLLPKSLLVLHHVN